MVDNYSNKQKEMARVNLLKMKMIESIKKDMIFPYQIPNTGQVIFTFIMHDGGIREGKVSIEHKI